MKNGIILLLFVATSCFNKMNAQTLTVTRGGSGEFATIKDARPINIVNGGNRFFITKNWKSAMMNFVQTTFDSEGKYVAGTKLEIAGGDMKNAFGIHSVLNFSGKNWALVENTNKTTSKNSLFAREIDTKGTVAKEETELMSFTYEKMMNSGFHFSSVSPDQTKLAIMGLFPYEKDQSAKGKLHIFDQQLKKTKEIEFTLPGEDTKNKTLFIKVANDGTFYILKRTTARNGEVELTVLQWNEKTSSFSEYAIDLVAPLYPTSYSVALNSDNEIIVAGVYRKRVTISAGEPMYNGIFYYNNKGKTENIMNKIEFDSPIENLEMRDIILNGDIVYITTEQYISKRDDTPANTTTIEYNYTYTRKSNFVFGINKSDGMKKFQVELAKNSVSRNTDLQDETAYFICGGKLTAIYNDEHKKYVTNEYGKTPVLVQITNDGLMQSPVVFKDKLKSDFTAYPSFAVQDSDNQISFMSGNGALGQIVTVKIE